EIFELEDPARSEHEFLGGDAGNRGFVQAQGVGDLAQHQRSHSDLSVLEEMPLPVDDRLRYAQDSLEPLLHVLDQPARLLKLMGELPAGLAAVVLQDVRVHAVDAQLGKRVWVEAGDPYSFDLFYDDVGYDVARLER